MLIYLKYANKCVCVSSDLAKAMNSMTVTYIILNKNFCRIY